MAGRSFGRPARRAICTRRSSGTSSRPGSVSSGARSPRARPRSSASPRSCARCSRPVGARSKTNSMPAASTVVRAARVAALDTRQAKDYGVDIGVLRDRWRDQAVEAGHDPTVIDERDRPCRPAGDHADRPTGRHRRAVGTAWSDRAVHDVRSTGRAARVVRATPGRRTHHNHRTPRRRHARRPARAGTPGLRPVPEIFDGGARRARTTPRRCRCQRDRHRLRCRHRTASARRARRSARALTRTGRGRRRRSRPRGTGSM